MAILDSGFSFTGRLGNFVAYRMRGVDGIVLRNKGGVSPKRIKEDPAFENTRNVNSEFRGRSAMTKKIMQMMYPLKALADYNIAGPLNALLTPIQKLDTESLYGMRHVQLTKKPTLLSGFTLNRSVPVETLLRCPLEFTLSRGDRRASVRIPELLPGINLHVAKRFPMYSIVCVLGIVPDFFHSSNGYNPSNDDYHQLTSVFESSEWFSALQGSGPIELNLTYSKTLPDEHFSIMLSIGLRFGTVADSNTIRQIQYAGAAKVLGVR